MTPLMRFVTTILVLVCAAVASAGDGGVAAEDAPAAMRIEVSTAAELIAAIGPDRTIAVAPANTC